MSLAERIAALIDNSPKPTGDDLPLIFNGREPRWLGNVRDYAGADALLIVSRCSAEKLSKADVLGRKCIIAYS